MKAISTLSILLCLITIELVKSRSVSMKAKDINQYINIEMASDPRRENSIVGRLSKDAKWVFIQSPPEWYKKKFPSENTLRSWYLTMTLAAYPYGFEAKTFDSLLSIEIEGATDSGKHADIWFAFSINDEKFITFGSDFDAKSGDNNIDTLIYPACGGGLADGSPKDLIPTNGDDFNTAGIRNGITQGNGFSVLSSSGNGNKWPFSFEFVNNPRDDTFTFRFISNTFPNGLECVYNENVPPNKEFKMYMFLDPWAQQYDHSKIEFTQITVGRERSNDNAIPQEDYLFNDYNMRDNIVKEVKQINLNRNIEVIIGISVVLMVLIFGVLCVWNKFVHSSVVKTTTYNETMPLLNVMD